VKADRDESSPYAAMLAAQDVAVKCKVSGAASPPHLLPALLKGWAFNCPCPAPDAPSCRRELRKGVAPWAEDRLSGTLLDFTRRH